MIREDAKLRKLFETRYPTGTVLTVAGITNNSLQNWFQRKLVIGNKGDQEDMKERFTGRRLFSFHDIMVFTLVKQLTDLGCDVKNAFKAANQFAHSASDRDGCRRLPAFPYVGGDEASLFDVATWLIVKAEQFLTVPQKKGEDVLSKVAAFHPDWNGFLVLKINPIFDHVVTKLGFHPEELTEWVYRGWPLKNSGWVE